MRVPTALTVTIFVLALAWATTAAWGMVALFLTGALFIELGRTLLTNPPK